MKKLVLTFAALFVLAGSTYTVSAPVSVMAQTTKPKKPAPQPAAIPIPVCPANDPNGCGIYD